MSIQVEQRPNAQFGPMGYDNMRYAPQPQFTNPWGPPQNPAAAQHQAHVYQHQVQEAQVPRSAAMQIPYNAPMQQPPALQTDMMNQRAYASPMPAVSQASYQPQPTSAPRYSPEYAHSTSPYAYDADHSRRSSFVPQSGRGSVSESMEAAHGMVPMNDDMTPRNIYASRQGSHDSYGFPSTHSSVSSMSNASGYANSYYGPSYNGSINGSIDGSVTDYSSASEDMGVGRTLPAPTQMMSGFPPEPASMMSQFNSKAAPSAQKKHKCKICDKRFTRPSSLQTHMYSHTGEKPFACDVEGCGRHFSVISNLRRHRKVHKDELSSNVSTGSRTSPSED